MNPSSLLRGSFCGLLSPSQCAEGINLVRANARRLIDDARLLFSAEHYPSAAQQAILAIEEAGKEAILRSVAAAETEQQAIHRWKDVLLTKGSSAPSAGLKGLTQRPRRRSRVGYARTFANRRCRMCGKTVGRLICNR